MVRLIINGSEHTIETPSGPSLLDVLREDLRLTGAKYGCGEGECGACTVLVDGTPTRACTQDVTGVAGPVTTVEGLADDRHLHRVQAAFVAERALQCGYCTPGMVMSSVALLTRDPAPDDAAIADTLAGNVCRCGGYPRIMQAIHRAAAGGDSGGSPVGDTYQAAKADAAESHADTPLWTVVLPPDHAAGGAREWGWSTPGGVRLTIDPAGTITAYTG